MWQFEAGHLAAAGSARIPGIFSMFKSMEYIYTDSDVTSPDNGSTGIAGWRGGVARPDNLLWALTVSLVALQIYRYGPKWWAGASRRIWCTILSRDACIRPSAPAQLTCAPGACSRRRNQFPVEVGQPSKPNDGESSVDNISQHVSRLPLREARV
jgi:hypothetical protein